MFAKQINRLFSMGLMVSKWPALNQVDKKIKKKIFELFNFRPSQVQFSEFLILFVFIAFKLLVLFCQLNCTPRFVLQIVGSRANWRTCVQIAASTSII
ncbi:hypothetical protein BpHYR1_014680 [Brachionus plicatilis]|uniref:Uncharacterized protein n=1 Tax=Brachionus plicatilis TaxID=10195 RepID=A0A3M7RHS3_BRAPC|nr:hypothetical protein BpHYR1_014680 [Brachionus plicatilis]